MHTKNKLMGVGAGGLVVGLLIGYFGAGVLNAPTATQSPRGNFVAGQNAGGRNGGMTRGNFGGMLSGTVAAKDASSITLNTRDGSSHVVLLSSSTNISKSVGGAVSDVVVGATVIVSGATNSDGSVSATMIQLRPAMPTGPQP